MSPAPQVHAGPARAQPPRSVAAPRRRPVSFCRQLIGHSLRRYAAELRRNEVNGWSTATGAQTHGYIHGLIIMGWICGRLSEARQKQLAARLSRISRARITRLDERLRYVPEAA